MTTIGYLKVFTEEQDLEKNKADILVLAHEKNMGKVEFIEEKVSGRVSWKKRKIAEVLDGLQKDDNLVVSELAQRDKF